MYIAAMTEKPGMEGIVSPLFGDAEYLTIMQAETASVLRYMAVRMWAETAVSPEKLWNMTVRRCSADLLRRRPL